MGWAPLAMTRKGTFETVGWIAAARRIGQARNDGSGHRAGFARQKRKAGLLIGCRSDHEFELLQAAPSGHCERSEAIFKHLGKTRRLLRRCAPRNDGVGHEAVIEIEHSNDSKHQSSHWNRRFGLCLLLTS